MGCGLANKKIKIYSTNIEKTSASRILSKYGENTGINISNITLPSKTNKDVYSEYKILHKIGSGTYGRVYKVEELRTGIIRAMKIIKKGDIQSEKQDNSSNNKQLSSDKNEFLDEIKILKTLDHPNIIKYIDYFIDYNFVYIILEYFPYGDLFEEISSWKIYSEEKACQIIYQVLIGLNYLHSNCIIHRDLKPENIILIKNDKCVFENSHHKNSFFIENIFSYNVNCTSNKFPIDNNLQKINTNKKLLNDSIDNDYSSSTKNNHNVKHTNDDSSLNVKESRIESNIKMIKNDSKSPNNLNSLFSIKIIDFGTGKIFKRKKNMHSINGTLHYLAPEILDSDYNEKVDIWACGVIFYLMLVGYMPFKGKSVLELIEAIKRGKYELNNNDWKNISTDVKHLLRCMLTYCPKKRISAPEALNHCFFNKMQKNISSSYEFKILKKALDNLRNMNMINKLRQATFSYLIHYFTTNKEMEKLNSAFTIIDKNKDGKISFEELKAGCVLICGENLSDIEISMLMDHIDYDKNGFIEYIEFIKVFMDTKLLSNEIKLKTAFDKFDLNKDGKLCTHEILNIFSGDVDNAFLKITSTYENSFQTRRVGIDSNLNFSEKVRFQEEGIDFIQFKEIMLKYLQKNDSAEEDIILNPTNFRNFLDNSANNPTDDKINKNSSSNDRKYSKSSRNSSKKRNNLKNNNIIYLKKNKTRSKSENSTLIDIKHGLDWMVNNNKINSINSSSQIKDAFDIRNPEILVLPVNDENEVEGLNVKSSDNVFIRKIDNFVLQDQQSACSKLIKSNSSQNLTKSKQNVWPLSPIAFGFKSNFYSKTFQINQNNLELTCENNFYFKKIKRNDTEKFNLLNSNKNN